MSDLEKRARRAYLRQRRTDEPGTPGADKALVRRAIKTLEDTLGVHTTPTQWEVAGLDGQWLAHAGDEVRRQVIYRPESNDLWMLHDNDWHLIQGLADYGRVLDLLAARWPSP